MDTKGIEVCIVSIIVATTVDPTLQTVRRDNCRLVSTVIERDVKGAEE